jgi:hypothetical protein
MLKRSLMPEAPEGEIPPGPPAERELKIDDPSDPSILREHVLGSEVTVEEMRRAVRNFLAPTSKRPIASRTSERSKPASAA